MNLHTNLDLTRFRKDWRQSLRKEQFILHKKTEMLNGMFGKMAEESIYQRKMIKKSEILSIKNIWSFI